MECCATLIFLVVSRVCSYLCQRVREAGFGLTATSVKVPRWPVRERWNVAHLTSYSFHLQYSSHSIASLSLVLECRVVYIYIYICMFRCIL
ncbi:hypothetical protein GGS21DRAFT_528223, partial [Xylaria nigripes]